MTKKIISSLETQNVEPKSTDQQANGPGSTAPCTDCPEPNPSQEKPDGLQRLSKDELVALAIELRKRETLLIHNAERKLHDEETDRASRLERRIQEELNTSLNRAHDHAMHELEQIDKINRVVRDLKMDFEAALSRQQNWRGNSRVDAIMTLHDLLHKIPMPNEEEKMLLDKLGALIPLGFPGSTQKPVTSGRPNDSILSHNGRGIGF